MLYSRSTGGVAARRPPRSARREFPPPLKNGSFNVQGNGGTGRISGHLHDVQAGVRNDIAIVAYTLDKSTGLGEVTLCAIHQPAENETRRRHLHRDTQGTMVVVNSGKEALVTVTDFGMTFNVRAFRVHNLDSSPGAAGCHDAVDTLGPGMFFERLATASAVRTAS